MRSRRTLFRGGEGALDSAENWIRNPRGARVLAVYSGGSYRWTRRSACIYKDFELVAAVSLERLTREKSAGVTPAQPMPNRAIDECLAIAGVGRGDIDVSRTVESLVRVSGFRLDRPVGARTGMVAAAGPAAVAARRSHDAQGGQDRRVGDLPKRTVSCSGRFRPRAPAFLQPSPRPCLARLFL